LIYCSPYPKEHFFFFFLPLFLFSFFRVVSESSPSEESEKKKKKKKKSAMSSDEGEAISIDFDRPDPTHTRAPQFQQKARVPGSKLPGSKKFPSGRRGSGDGGSGGGSGGGGGGAVKQRFQYNSTNTIVSLDATLDRQNAGDAVRGVAMAILVLVECPERETDDFRALFGEETNPIDDAWESEAVRKPSIEAVETLLRWVGLDFFFFLISWLDFLKIRRAPSFFFFFFLLFFFYRWGSTMCLTVFGAGCLSLGAVVFFLFVCLLSIFFLRGWLVWLLVF
jgi:hypothetical protein